MMITRRTLVAALGALTVMPLPGCRSRGPDSVEAPRGPDPFADGLEPTAVAAIAASFAAASAPNRSAEGRAALDKLFPNGRADGPTLRTAAADDFRAGRTFRHAGWHLSHTEGWLFTLLAETNRPARNSSS